MNEPAHGVGTDKAENPENNQTLAWLPVDGSASPASASHVTRWLSRVAQVLGRRPVAAGFERGHP